MGGADGRWTDPPPPREPFDWDEFKKTALVYVLGIIIAIILMAGISGF